jgi:hypothetical protein
MKAPRPIFPTSPTVCSSRQCCFGLDYQLRILVLYKCLTRTQQYIRTMFVFPTTGPRRAGQKGLPDVADVCGKRGAGARRREVPDHQALECSLPGEVAEGKFCFFACIEPTDCSSPFFGFCVSFFQTMHGEFLRILCGFGQPSRSEWAK